MALPQLTVKDVLILVDVQNDFCPGGLLALESGDSVIPPLNKWSRHAESQGARIIATRDWHPEGHISFKEQGGPWPVHCVQGTKGAEFHPGLYLPQSTTVINKGEAIDHDQYSAFDKSDLAESLKEQGIVRVWIGGLAEDVCVRQSALDCLEAGFETHVIEDATKPVDPESNTLEELVNRGAVIESTD